MFEVPLLIFLFRSICRTALPSPVTSLDHWCRIIVDGIRCIFVRVLKVCNGSMFIGWSYRWYGFVSLSEYSYKSSSSIELSTLFF